MGIQFVVPRNGPIQLPTFRRGLENDNAGFFLHLELVFYWRQIASVFVTIFGGGEFEIYYISVYVLLYLSCTYYNRC